MVVPRSLIPLTVAVGRLRSMLAADAIQAAVKDLEAKRAAKAGV
jgi:hypothetical protein